MVQTIYFLAFVGCVRIWWEFIPSDSNWSDGASRDLTDDAWAKDNGFSLTLSPPLHMPSGTIIERLAAIAAWGLDSGIADALGPIIEVLSRCGGRSVGVVARRAAPPAAF
jgi:hypothetical protein